MDAPSDGPLAAPAPAAELGRVPGLPARLHLVGAGGAGLSGAALLLARCGHQVSGSDRARSSFVAALEAAGIPVEVGPSATAALPAGVEVLVRSAAVPEDDPQVVEARRRGLAVLKYSELLALLCPASRTLAVAGTHGKTTTSWMLLHALEGVARAAGRTAPMPGALVGGAHRTRRTGAIAPAPGAWFAVEACEYDRSFLRLEPRGAAVTNVEADHLDCYGSLENVERAFACFLDRVHPDGLAVVGREVPARVASAAACECWRLGHELEVELVGERRGRFRFRLRGPGWASPETALAVPGDFNVDNAALALALAVGLVAREWSLAPAEAAAEAARAIAEFPGADRRFEPWGEVAGVEVVHDYAHHPTEVRATLMAARRAFPERALHVLFQPHQHSRTARMLGEFVEALRGTERVVVADVYGARAPLEALVAGAPELVARLLRAGVEAIEGGGAERAARELARGLAPGDVALVLGAGDVDGVKDVLLDELSVRGPGAGRAGA